jgi:hypothetical protein
MRRLLITALLLGPLTCTAETVYKCVDPGGRITFSDTGCPENRTTRETRVHLDETRWSPQEEAKFAPDPASGVREGEWRMLDMMKRQEQIERSEKQRERRAFLREHESYGERVERRNRKIQRRNAWER